MVPAASCRPTLTQQHALGWWLEHCCTRKQCIARAKHSSGTYIYHCKNYTTQIAVQLLYFVPLKRACLPVFSKRVDQSTKSGSTTEKRRKHTVGTEYSTARTNQVDNRLMGLIKCPTTQEVQYNKNVFAYELEFAPSIYEFGKNKRKKTRPAVNAYKRAIQRRG